MPQEPCQAGPAVMVLGAHAARCGAYPSFLWLGRCWRFTFIDLQAAKRAAAPPAEPRWPNGLLAVCTAPGPCQPTAWTALQAGRTPRWRRR